MTEENDGFVTPEQARASLLAALANAASERDETDTPQNEGERLASMAAFQKALQAKAVGPGGKTARELEWMLRQQETCRREWVETQDPAVLQAIVQYHTERQWPIPEWASHVIMNILEQHREQPVEYPDSNRAIRPTKRKQNHWKDECRAIFIEDEISKGASVNTAVRRAVEFFSHPHYKGTGLVCSEKQMRDSLKNYRKTRGLNL